MRERFSYTGKGIRRYSVLGSVTLQLVLWAGIFSVFLYGLNYFGNYTEEKQKESLERALQRDIAQCYAVEGIYPPGISYLEEHYGLQYDTTRFYVDYRHIGSNLYPDLTVLEVQH